jgi:xylan 1,4-beta-xylosidase
MFGMLGSERLEVTSSGALPTEQIVEGGVRAQPDINAMAARKNSEIEILVWHYHDDDLPGAEAPVDLTIHNFPENVERALLEHFRVDTQHSNAFTLWQEMGSPQSPTAREVEQLRRAGQLQLLTSPSWVSIAQGTLRLHFSIPRQGLSLVRIAW